MGEKNNNSVTIILFKPIAIDLKRIEK